MYKQHPDFSPPEDNQRIWRYLDFTKLVSLLDKEALYFSRPERFDDPFEGSFSEINAQEWSSLSKQARDDLSYAHREVKRLTAINCWHMNDNESAAMWKLYLQSGEGVAIQSTFARLVKSLERTRKDICIGQVSYVDYSSTKIPERNVLYPFVYKRKSFEHEKELRAMILAFFLPDNESESDNHTFRFERISDADADIGWGAYVDIDINALVEKIHVSPSAPCWFYELVVSVTRKYGFEFPVRRSSLDKDPVF
jgi:hypothetical protein